MIIANESSIDITMKFHFAMAICDGPMEMECSQSAMIFLVYNERLRDFFQVAMESDERLRDFFQVAME